MNPHYTRGQSVERMWAKLWVGLAVWVCFSPITHAPTGGFFTSGRDESGQEGGDVLGALNRIAQVLDSHERHTTLYERVSMLEENLNKKTENEMKLESEVLELRAKIPALEAEIQTIPEMRKDLAEFEAKIEKLVHDYEAKLSALATEVIRLKKNGARRKDLQTLSDGSDNVLLRIDAPVCPEVGLGMAAERVGDQCLYFSWGTALNWTAAHRHCQSLGGDLSAPEDLLPLKTFLHRAFARGPSIWLGASYNIEDFNNTADSKAQLSPTPSANHTDDSEGSFSFRLNILGSSGTSSNRIDDDIESDGDRRDDGFSSNGLTGGIALRDEAIAPDGELIGDIGRLSREWFLDSSSRRNLRSRLRDTSLPSFVDVILLKEPVKPLEETGHSRESSHPSSVLTLDGTLPGDSRSGVHTQSDPDARLESPSGRASHGVFRDVRDVLEDPTGEQESGTSGHPEEESKSTGKAKMNCMLLQQKESLEYELVGQPCDEQHRFVCEILSSINSDLKFTPDNFLHE